MWEWKRQEALWRKSCSASHKIWCNCGEWTRHVPGWSITTGGNTPRDGGISFITEDGDPNITEEEEDILIIEEDDITPGKRQRYYLNIDQERENILL